MGEPVCSTCVPDVFQRVPQGRQKNVIIAVVCSWQRFGPVLGGVFQACSSVFLSPL